MENGEVVIISGKSKPITGLLVSGLLTLILCVGSIFLNAASRNQTNKTMSIVVQVLLGLSALISLRYYFMSKKSGITVTNMRITGATAWGSAVNLPLNQVISASLDPTGALIIATSSGQTAFAKMDNTVEIYNEINRLLMSRQR